MALLPENCRRIQPDEVTLYQGLARQYEVQQVLAVGYEAEQWAVGNNRYLSRLAEQRWLISVNSKGEYWIAWQPLLERRPDLRLLVLHLGLPAGVETAPDAATAHQALKEVLALAQFPEVHVKLSGFYALPGPVMLIPIRLPDPASKFCWPRLARPGCCGDQILVPVWSD